MGYPAVIRCKWKEEDMLEDNSQKRLVEDKREERRVKMNMIK